MRSRTSSNKRSTSINTIQPQRSASLQAVDRTFAALTGMLGMGAPREYGGIEDLRMGRIRGFDKHLVFYRPIEGGIEVVRVLHASRDLAGLFEEE